MTTTVTATNAVNVRSVALRLQGQDCSNRLFVEFDAQVPINAQFDLIGPVYDAVQKLIPAIGTAGPALIEYLLGRDAVVFEQRWRPGFLDSQSLELGYYKISFNKVENDLTVDFTVESKRAMHFDRVLNGNYRDVCLLVNEFTPYFGEISARVNVEKGIGILNIRDVSPGAAVHMRLQGRLELVAKIDEDNLLRRDAEAA